MPSDSFFFWSVIVIIALIVMVLCARFIMRVALFIVSILVIWYCLSYVGLVEPPQQFFKAYEFKKQGESAAKEEARGRSCGSRI